MLNSAANPGFSQPPPKKVFHSVLAVLIIFLAALIVLRWHERMPMLYSVKHGALPLLVAQDSELYLAMAKDGLSQIRSPFSKRVLYPWLVESLSQFTSQPLPRMFLALNLAALLTLTFCLAEILRITIGQPLLVLPFLLTPFVFGSLEMAYLPDLFHMALAAIFFLLLLHQKKGFALLVLFIAFLARENTMILCLFTAAVGWMSNEKKLSLGALGVLIAGMAADSFFVKLGQPNLHQMPDFLYLLGKIPYYFLFNFLGIRIWSDVRPDAGIPLFTWHLPTWLQKITADQTIGLTSGDWHFSLYTLIVWLTLFGIAPVLLYYTIRQRRPSQPMPFAVRLALIYGIFSFAIGPLLGDWVIRLVGYGWPAFWIALPVLFFKSGFQFKTSSLVFLCAAVFIASWWPSVFRYDLNSNANPWPSVPVLLIYLPLWLILRTEARKPERLKSSV